MSNIGGYTTRAFSESQKFLVLDPATGTTSLVAGSSLVDYITPSLNTVKGDTTRIAAENTDYEVGTFVQTAGRDTIGDNLGGTYLVVGAGEGDVPMLNGNELLLIRGDDLLREQLISEDPGEGASRVSMEGGPTVQEAVTQNATDINQRVIYVGSVAELEALSLDEGVNVYLTEGGRSGPGVIKSGTHASDPQKGVFIDLANGNYWQRQYGQAVDSNPAIKPDWFGVTYDNIDSSAALDAAIAFAGADGEINLSSGQLAYSGSISFLRGQKITGPGNNALQINVTVASPGDYAVDLSGVSLTVARDFRIITTYNGIKFAPTDTADCLLNLWENVEVIGDNIGLGRGADPTVNDNVGVYFGPMNGSKAAFFNTVRRPYIRGFNTNVLFDAPSGSSQLGGNGNHVLDAHHQGYWYANRYRAIENEVRGGFYNQSSGTASFDTVMHKLENRTTRNEIDSAIGEPGANTKAFDIEAGCDNNYIPRKSYNVDSGSVDLGNNNTISENYGDPVSRFYSGLPENTYQKIKIATLSSNGTGLVGRIDFEGRNVATSSLSYGTHEFYASRNGSGVITARTKRASDQRDGSALPVMVGLEVSGSDLYAVFNITNNGTSTSALLRIACAIVGDVSNVLSPSFSATTAPANSYGGDNAQIFNGRIQMQGLPTSSAGLPPGSIWNDAGTLKLA